MKKLLSISSWIVMIIGVVSVCAGAWGIWFTYQNVVREKIVTPTDALIPEQPVRGPLTLKAQTEIIREHTLKTTGGKTFAEMPRQIEKISEDGKSTMVPNAARDIWITATTLTTALNLAILAYAFSGLLIVFGGLFFGVGLLLFTINKVKKIN